MLAKNIAADVFKEESQAIINLINHLDNNFESSINVILASSGRIISTGMGKSGIIAKKFSSTLASTGTPSFFLHPSEAFHGDLGMVKNDDLVFAISNSGETDEVLKLIPFFKDNGNIILSMTGNPASTLAKNSKFHLNIEVEKEVCPLNLTPTTSSIVALAMADAIVVTLIRLRGFEPVNYARFHPGGRLGRKLLLRIKDLMLQNQGDLPTISENKMMPQIIHNISSCGYGLTVVVSKDNYILGIITDGDIRRTMEKDVTNFFNIKACDIMKKKPITLKENATLSEAEELFHSRNINSILVENNNRLIGIVTYKQLMHG